MDSLKAAHSTISSLDHRIGKPARIPKAAAPNAPANSWGFPQPGVQSPSPAFVTGKHYFVDDATWNAILSEMFVCGECHVTDLNAYRSWRVR